jgi:ATP-dependent exoDNAse (exonuclease V) beta subunit
MPRQVSDEEYNFLQQKRMTADFVESIYNDPQLNKEAKRLIKRKYPNLAIPDYDMEQKIESRFSAEEQKKQKEAADAQAAKDRAAWDASRAKVKKQYGFTDEGLADLEKWMHEKAVADHEVAAEYRAQKNPQTSSPTYDSHFWNHEKAPNFAEITKDPEAWGRKELIGAIHRDEERERSGR